MTYLVGLSGGIACGKSTVEALFSSLGTPIIDADQLARQVLIEDGNLLVAIHQYFGEGVVMLTGELNRSALKNRIFTDKRARLWLEALLHPPIIQAIKLKIKALPANAPYAIISIPLLLETGPYYFLDHYLLVDALPYHQEKRLLKRDGMSLELAQAIMAQQASRRERFYQADSLIFNYGSIEHLQKVVTDLDSYFKGLGQ